MRLLYVNSLYPPDIAGDVEIVVSTLVQALRTRGHEASVLTTHGGPGVVEESVEGVPVHRIGSKNIHWHFPPSVRSPPTRTAWHVLDSFNLAMGRAVGRRLDEIRPDIVVCHDLAGFSAAVWPQARRRGIPVVQVLHDYYAICPRSTMFRHGTSCIDLCASCTALRLPHRHASQAVSAAVGVSRAVLETHLRHGLFSRAAIKTAVHMPRSLPPMPPRATRQRDDRRLLNFGFIGELNEASGVELLATAFARVARRSPRPMQLLIAGGGKEAEVARLRREHESSWIRFLGPVNALEFFAQLDITVMPALWQEPFSGAALESLAQGVPVIGALRGGMGELIHHEVNGLLFEPGERGALDAAMTQLAEDGALLQRMRRLSRMSVTRLLDLDRVLDDYESIFRLLLGEGGAGSSAIASDPVRPKAARDR